MDSVSNQIFSECQRCGTCCKKGGPALHDEDKQIIDCGNLPLAALYTIRKGELATDNVSGGIIRLQAEIIKIKSCSDSSACMYFNDEEMSCRIYDHRPVECRTLECWNTKKIEAIYAHTRLTRCLVLEKAGWLTDLVKAHESKCDLKRIQDLAESRESGDSTATCGLIEIVNYDFYLRKLVVEKGKVDPEMLDFLFGRPLSAILRLQFGVKVEKLKSA